MRFRSGLRGIAIAAGWATCAFALGQTPAAATPPPNVPTALPAGLTPLKLTDPPAISTMRLPADNPFGANVEAAAFPPPKPVFTETVVNAPFFGALRVDRAGRVTQTRRVRDPIPSLAADSKKSLDRWTFEPAKKGGQPVDTWASARLDLAVTVKPPKIEQIMMTPVTPSSPIPAPFEWGSDDAWYAGLKVTPPSDGTIP